MDHVHLLGDAQVDLLTSNLTVVWDKRERGSVPFLPFLSPYHGVFIAKKTTQ